jgi:hypothetical protein
MVMGTQSQPGEAGKEGKQALSGSINIRDLFTRFYSMAPAQRARIIDQLDPQSTAALKQFLPEPLATFLDEMGKSSGADVNMNIGDGARVPRSEDVDMMVERVLKGQGQANRPDPRQQVAGAASNQLQSMGSERMPAQGSVAPRPQASNSAQPSSESQQLNEVMRQLGLG